MARLMLALMLAVSQQVLTPEERALVRSVLPILERISEDPDPVVATTAVQLQDALDAAAPGDAIEVPRGTTIVGHFTLPQKASEVTLRGCGAELRSPDHLPVLQVAPNGDNWRVAGCSETDMLTLSGAAPGDLVRVGAHDQTLAQVPRSHRFEYVHFKGDPERGAIRGIALHSIDATVTRSRFTDFKATGRDTQCIAGWNGPGPYTITDNYCEATGENIIFGGSDPSIEGVLPSDILIERNTLVKPLAWRGTTFNSGVKNLFELKAARRVRFRHNTLDGAWVAGQTGYAVLLKSVNQDGGQPWAQVHDVEVAFNTITNVSSGFNLHYGPPPHASVPMSKVWIHHNTVTTDRAALGGDGRCLLLQGADDITFEFNTCTTDGTSSVYVGNAAVSSGFVLRGNIIVDRGAGDAWGIMGSGSGEGASALAMWTPGAVFELNLIVTPTPHLYQDAAKWPQWTSNTVVTAMPADTRGFGAAQ